MPRIPDRYLNVVFYLYDNADAALEGRNTGGTGFLVRVPFETDPDHGFVYAVSNRHVVRSGASVIRLNTEDGGVDIIETGPEEWAVHPSGDDLAIKSIGISGAHKVSYLSLGMFATEAELEAGEYGVGDGAFMIGRFVAHDGGTTNVPAVGFGNISIPPAKMRRTDGFQQLSFGVEMRSMRGNSGSPVFTFTEPWDMGTNSTRIGSQRVRFLGVDWGQVVHPVEIRERIVRADEAGLRPGEREAKFVSLNTGMNGVVPAWKLRELLFDPAFVKAREDYERNWQANGPSRVVEEADQG